MHAAPGSEAGPVRAFDEAASRYDTSGARFARPVAARLVELAALRPGQRVLDVGCGAGAVLIPAAKAVRPGQVTGIDLSTGMLERAAARVAAEKLDNVRLQPGNAADPPFAPGSFGVILASLVMYLLPDPDAALVNWRDLLTGDGIAGFSWGVRPDPRWSPVFAAVDRYAGGAAGFESYVRRLGPPDKMTATLHHLGYGQVRTMVETVEVRYSGPRQWWDASWTEAPRLAWRHIPEAERKAARKDAFALLETMREHDGSLVRHIRVAYAIAERSPR